jgi:hypothetical protein
LVRTKEKNSQMSRLMDGTWWPLNNSSPRFFLFFSLHSCTPWRWPCPWALIAIGHRVTVTSPPCLLLKRAFLSCLGKKSSNFSSLSLLL